MKKISKSLVCVSVLAALGMSQAALAESPLTGNIGFASNYIWRGLTQTGDGSAISGGIDYAQSGFYAGVWVSNESWTATPGYEEDLYLGYGGSASGLSYDISYIKYGYPVGTGKDDFAEAILKLGYGPATFTYAKTVSKEDGAALKDDSYMSLSAVFEVKKDLSLGLTYGSYDFEAAGADYTHIQVSLSKGDFTFAYDKVSPDVDGAYSDDPRMSVTWKKSFDL
ncbi:MAG: TorF family putative porin [Gammaproteobacteria bacterium]|nr:TorF family putative porin [Gammaproteobacteria bacterium]MDH5653981.1 TorF family putative porin [Gammaproteobacteria bacterium]